MPWATLDHMLIGMSSVLSSLAREIQEFSGVSPVEPAVVAAYWN
jgi:hypothetical protein